MTLADLSSLALFTQDADGHIVTWNRGAERVFGYSEVEVAGQSFIALVPPHARGDLESVDRRVVAGERFERVFLEIRRKDGMPVPIALSLSPVLDRTGVFRGGVGCCPRPHGDSPRSSRAGRGRATLPGGLAAVHRDDRERIGSLMENAVATGQGFEEEHRVEVDGNTQTLAMRAEPAIGSSGEVVGLRGVSHDVTITATNAPISASRR